MKTFAEFKRALTLGTLVHTVHHQTITGRDESGISVLGDKDMGTRPVSIVQTNAIAFRTEKGTDSWIHWPAAKDVVIKDNTMIVYDHDCRFRDRTNPKIKLLTYTIQPAEV